MKSIAGIGIFLVLGLLVAYVVGFQPIFGEKLPYDDEQTGLKDRIVIKFSHVVAENTPKGLAAARFAALVKQKSRDRVEIQVFPNGMLYSENREVAALRRGDIQMIAPSFSNMNAIDPAWYVMDLPFAFRDQQDVNEALRGILGKRLFETLEPYGMKGGAYWSNGFRQMTNDVRPLRTPDDFRGLKFRVQPSEVLERQFNLLGASTISTPFNEVYRNLEAGAVDGQENTISNILSKRLYQFQRYMTISNHGYLGYVVIFNEEFWNGLPPDVQLIIEQALRETTAWNNQAALKQEKGLRLLRERARLDIITLTDEDKAQWKDKLSPIYKEFADTIGPGLLEEIDRP
ncbi:C4-dicarboxylate ABC transporter [Paenibacillus darwinianus]|uniref:C4-dicarboxylate ABC transporter n=1 Tax=Paenibacillus darwinianus TaxID=1380763 RepID=A0A9W5S1L4_9BACL|nr:DctP family TRAP transporter solute-binding subunit [Paenibacillus darwinianus]EXX90383.1 C4-dicarboxylate ABC transporter [Paenibacillus darwinianus]EXX91097.1 C4-dicarboxylate ABC transporter [Paenibacillus darwinianus]EXX91961.1 C4-dicarboxylate ABC transporter [Paenibacillus darwinianus]